MKNPSCSIGKRPREPDNNMVIISTEISRLEQVAQMGRMGNAQTS